MTKQKINIRAIIAILLISTVLFIFSWNRTKETYEMKQVGIVEKRNFKVTVQTVGVLEAAKSHMISSQVRGSQGKIIYLIGDGEQVNQDDVLVRLDPSPFEDEIDRIKAQADSLSASFDASTQLFEGEKNEVEQMIATAEYNKKVAELDLERLVKGEGPLKLTQYKDEMDKAGLELSKYKAYTADLEALQEKGFDDPAEISQAREKLSAYKEKFEAAKSRYTSFEKYVLPSMIESAKAKVQNSSLTLKQTEQASVHKIAKAKASAQQVEGKLRAARAALKQAETELEKTVIKAPFAGMVIHYETFRDGQMRKPREGDMVIMNQPILYLPDISNMIVKAQVREIDLHKTAIGQEASITVEAYPDTVYHGNLSFIGAVASRRTNFQEGEKYFQVTFSLKSSDKRLRPGMTARIIVLSADLKNALSIPIQAIFHDGKIKYCYVLKGNEFKKSPVQTGLENEDYTEIISGLKENEKVSLIRPDTAN